MKSQKKKVTWKTIYFTQNAKNVVITSLMMLQLYTKQQVMLLDDILLIPDEAFFSTCESPMRENKNGGHCFGASA